MPTPLVSVIVPVYKCRDTLEECLDSLLAQTWQALEIVVVNDGSPDDEQEIVDDYVRRHPDKIKSFVKENGGLSDARNFGVARSTGEYVGYVDSDDFVEPDMFERLVTACETNDCDISIGKYIHYGLDGSRRINGGLKRDEGEVFPGHEFLMTERSMVVWNKLYRRWVVERFTQPIRWFEDVAWTPVVMTHVDRVCFVDGAFYHYVRREGSIASSHEDPRTLEGIGSVFHAMEHSNPDHRAVVQFWAARRLHFESTVRPVYADRYLSALEEIAPDLIDNPFLLADDYLRANVQPFLDDQPIIPKRLFWHAELQGRDGTVESAPTPPHPSWTETLVHSDAELRPVQLPAEPDDPTSERFCRHQRADLAALITGLRLIHEEGGVYLDARLVAHRPLAPHLIAEAFLAYESASRLGPVVLAARPHHPVIKELIDRLEASADEDLDDRDLVPRLMHDLVGARAGARLDGSAERFPDLTLHPVSVFSQRLGSSNVTEVAFTSADASLDTAMFDADYVDRLVDRVISLEQTERRLQGDLEKARQQLSKITSSNRWRLAWRLSPLDRLNFLSTVSAVRRARSQRADPTQQLRDEYARAIDAEPIDEHLALFESFYGRGVISNPAALFAAWTQRSDFEDFTFLWALDELDDHEEVVRDMTAQFTNVRFVQRGTIEYYRGLATARYLINDVTFYFDFVKRPEQVYLNTWHSITVKSLGFDIPGALDQKNVVRICSLRTTSSLPTSSSSRT